MQKNIIRFSLLFVLSLTFMSISAMAQATTSTTTFTTPIVGSFTACNGETVNFTGEVRSVIHMTVSTIGRVNIKVGDTLQATGVGLVTGVTYVANQTVEFGDRYDSVALAPFNLTQTAHLNFIGQGAVPNARVRLLIHMTVNANGEATATNFDFTSDCQ